MQDREYGYRQTDGGRNKWCCATQSVALLFLYMPAGTMQKVEALRADFRSAAQLADMLGVSRSQITRWLRGAGIDPLNAEKVDLLELVWSNLLRLYARDDAVDGPLWFPQPYQGEGRHDNPDEYGCLYLADRAVSCVVEQLAAFRGQ